MHDGGCQAREKRKSLSSRVLSNFPSINRQIYVMVQFLNWINFLSKLVQYFLNWFISFQTSLIFLNWFIFLNQFEIFKLVSFFPTAMFLETITQYDLYLW